MRTDAPCTTTDGPTASTSWSGCSAEEVAQVERPNRLGLVVWSVEEAAVDAFVGGPIALVGLLDAELAVRERVASHLDPAESLTGALGEQEHVEVDLGGEDLVHAAEVPATGPGVLVAVEVLAPQLQAPGRVDELVAERAALAALAPVGLWLGRSGRRR